MEKLSVPVPDLLSLPQAASISAPAASITIPKPECAVFI
jgi:hypothetical protein